MTELTKTIEEVAEHIKLKSGFFDFTFDALVEFTTFDALKALGLLKEDAEPWDTTKDAPRTREGVVEVMRDYMSFAWEKCRDHRGLSASRSVNRFEAWLWILDEPLDVEEVGYANYGAPFLMAICEKYGFDVPEGSDLPRMARGESCEQDCQMGCGG